MMHGYGYGFMGFGWLFQLIILLLFFLIVWWLIRSSGTFGYKAGRETAEEILKKRLAKGEISEKEYRKLREEIKD